MTQPWHTHFFRKRMLLSRVVFALMLLCSLNQAWADNTTTNGSNTTLVAGGTGSGTQLLKLLFIEFAKQEPSFEGTVVSPALGSQGGINALIAGKIDIVILSSELKPAVLDQLGRHFVLGKSPFIMVTNGGQRKNGFTLDELAKVYLGQTTTWDNGAPIRLILRDLNDADSKQLMAMSGAMAQAIKVAGNRPGMVMGNDDLETLEIESTTRGSLGPSLLGMVHTMNAPLKVLPINGVVPSLANLQNGSYPWHKTLRVVLARQPSPIAEKFFMFLQSNAAKELLLKSQFQPMMK